MTLFAETLHNLCSIRKCGSQTSHISILLLGNLLEVHILRPHSRPPESETLGANPKISFNQSSWDPDAHSGLRTSALKYNTVQGSVISPLSQALG